MNAEESPMFSNPGPGAYSPQYKFESTMSSPYSTTLKSRIEEKQVATNPGPGTYKQYSIFEQSKSGATLAGRTQIKQTSDVPGPGTYCPSPTRNKNASILAGRTYKPGVLDWESKKRMDNPSPNQYNIEKRHSGRQITMAGRTDLFHNNEAPGPGAYEVNQQFGQSAKGCTFAGRTNQGNTSDQNPGPGTYQVSSTFKKGGISISGRPAKRGGIIE